MKVFFNSISTDFFCLCHLLRGLLTSLIMTVDLPSSAKFCYFIYFEVMLLGAHRFMVVIYFCWVTLLPSFSISCNTSCLKDSVVWYINIVIPALVVQGCTHFHAASSVSPFPLLSVLQKFVKTSCLLVVYSHLFFS